MLWTWPWVWLGFPGGLDSKESAFNVGNLGLIPGLRGSPGGGNGNPLQHSYLGNPMDRGAWGLQSMGSPRVRYDWATSTLNTGFGNMVNSMCEQNIEGRLWVVLEMQPLTRFKELYLPFSEQKAIARSYFRRWPAETPVASARQLTSVRKTVGWDSPEWQENPGEQAPAETKPWKSWECGGEYAISIWEVQLAGFTCCLDSE